MLYSHSPILEQLANGYKLKNSLLQITGAYLVAVISYTKVFEIKPENGAWGLITGQFFDSTLSVQNCTVLQNRGEYLPQPKPLASYTRAQGSNPLVCLSLTLSSGFNSNFKNRNR